MESEFYAEWPDVEPTYNDATGEWENTEEAPERVEAREAFENKMEPRYTQLYDVDYTALQQKQSLLQEINDAKAEAKAAKELEIKLAKDAKEKFEKEAAEKKAAAALKASEAKAAKEKAAKEKALKEK